MKKRVKVMLIGGLAGLSLGCWQASGDLEVSAGVTIHSTTEFHQPLAGLGAWVNIGHFGQCWHPSHVARSWRPYCDGLWEWTDCGWYWQSDETWAWACYHYGSWVEDPTYGWVWVPGTEWAPAWVNWRESDDYVGWAPCAPPGIALAPSEFVFVGAPHFCDPIRPSLVIINNRTIIERTKLVSGVKRETRAIEGVSRRVIVNPGPRLDLVQHATRRTLQPVPIREMAQRTVVPKTLAPTGSERQRVFQEHGQNPPIRERSPGVQKPLPPPPRELRVAPNPNPPTIPSRTGHEEERVYPRPPNAPTTPTPRVIPAPQKPTHPPATPPPAQPERKREKPRDGGKESD